MDNVKGINGQKVEAPVKETDAVGLLENVIEEIKEKSLSYSGAIVILVDTNNEGELETWGLRYGDMTMLEVTALTSMVSHSALNQMAGVLHIDDLEE